MAADPADQLAGGHVGKCGLDETDIRAVLRQDFPGLGPGVGVSGSDPLYVVKLDASRREVVVGPKAALACAGASLREINWLSPEAPRPEGMDVEVKLRSASPAVPARVFADGRIRFGEPQLGVAPGQACVFYRGERVMGGGFIAASSAAAAA